MYKREEFQIKYCFESLHVFVLCFESIIAEWNESKGR